MVHGFVRVHIAYYVPKLQNPRDSVDQTCSLQMLDKQPLVLHASWALGPFSP